MRYSSLVLVCLLCLPCSAQESERRAGVGKVGKSSAGAREIVEALANRNHPPKHVGEFHEPIFDAKFDWREDERVWDALDLATKHAEEAWPELVKHLNDDRYCVTYESFSEYTYDFTVGRVCRVIILRSLSAGYFSGVEWRTKKAYLTMETAGFLRDPKTLKAWCEKRRDKKLYELQMEMCEWAKTEIEKGGRFFQHAQENQGYVDRRRRYRAAQDASQDKNGRPLGRLRPGGNYGYNSEKAAAIRKKNAIAAKK